MEAPDLRSAAFWSEDSASVITLGNPRRGADLSVVENAARRVPEIAGQVIVETSGSGRGAKFVCLSRDALRQSARAVNAHLNASAADRWLCALPTFHVGGLGIYARAFESRASVFDFEQGWDSLAFVNRAEAVGATLSALVPTQVADLVSTKASAPSSLRAVIVGGGHLSAQLLTSARRLGWPLLRSYGMTEAASQIATEAIDAVLDDCAEDDEPLPILPHWEVRVDPQQRLEIRGESLFSGYFFPADSGSGGGRFEAATSEKSDGWFRTSDLGKIKGRHVIVAGRADRVVKMLGELVDVDAVEKALLDLLEVGERSAVCVEAVDDERCGSRLVVITESAFDEHRLGEVKARYNEAALPFARLDGALRVDAIPRSPLGKIRRHDLRRLARLR